MDTRLSDKAASRILRTVAKKTTSTQALRKLRDDLRKVVVGLPNDIATVLSRSFEVIRDRWHPAGQLASSALIDLLSTLNRNGFTQSATETFNACLDLLKTQDLPAITPALPSVLCADLWINNSDTNKQSALQSIAEANAAFYGTIWCDWYSKRAKVKNLVTLAVMVLEGRKRPPHLPDAPALLSVIIHRDTKHILASRILSEIERDELALKVLIRSCIMVAHAQEVYARETACRFLKDGGGVFARRFADSLLELLTTSQPSSAEFYSRFVAHVITTWSLAKGGTSSETETIDSELQRVTSHILLAGQTSTSPDYLVTCAVKSVSQTLLNVRSKISLQGALELAIALRTSHSSANAYDALWSATFNMGIRQVGKPDSNETFDPIIHEDVKGGLIRGDRCRIRLAGWKLGDDVLLRAQVEPD